MNTLLFFFLGFGIQFLLFAIVMSFLVRRARLEMKAALLRASLLFASRAWPRQRSNSF
jgi:hypothetical protein